MTVPDRRSELLRTAPLDSWIALSDDESRIIATGSTYEEVAAELEQMGDTSAVILKTPQDWHPYAL